MSDRIETYVTRVRAHQTDVNGAMYHAAYFDIFDDARIETFRQLGYDYARMLRTGLRPVIRRAEAEYRLPALMDDVLTVQVTLERMTAATLSIRYDCRRDGQQVAVGHAQFAFVDDQGRPARIPRDLREVVRDSPGLLSAS